VKPGMTVYVAGGGPVGLACAASCHLLGAAVVIVGDMIPERLKQAKSSGAKPLTSKKPPSLAKRWKIFLACLKWICASIAWALRPAGMERCLARSAGHRPQLDHGNHPRGRALGIPGLYVTGDPAASMQRKGWQPWASVSAGLGEVARVCDWAVPGEALQPRSG